MGHIDAIGSKCDCSGCTACLHSCPKHCIEMKADGEGFLYPMVDLSRCVDCGTCVRICPWQRKNTVPMSVPLEVYAAKHRSDNVRSKSSSGGMFTAFSDVVLENEGVVCGAVFDVRGQHVVHSIARTREERDAMCGSKYVQSVMGDIFVNVEKLLRENILVMFSGTPCQVAGLKAFLKCDYDNLLLVDILCHSVPSPAIFRAILGDKRAIGVTFRNKARGWRNSYEFSIKSDSGTVINKTFLTMFFKGLINRPSCYNCRFASTLRVSDITIGDFWEINKVVPVFDDDKGVSCVFVNTEKGRRYINAINNKIDFIQATLPQAIQTCMLRPVTRLRSRDVFWNDYTTKGFAYCEKKWGGESVFMTYVRRVVVPILNAFRLRDFVRKLRTCKP